MQNSKGILICLEQLNAGGIETAVVNQAIALKNKGHKVIVLAKSGIYTDVLKTNGITQINMEFTLQNNFELGLTEKICNIIKENDIGQVHIHQFPCILSVWLACIKTNIPYVAFLHTTLLEVYKWYENTYSIFKYIFPLYYENAYKIVSISEKAIQNHLSLFPNVDNDKYIVLHNSLNFENYISQKSVTNIKNFLHLTRFATEKDTSIKNAIDLFIEFVNQVKEDKKKFSLQIVGDGPTKPEIKEYIKLKNINNYNIKILEATNDVQSKLEECDVLIGIGRCILEAIAMKRVAIISGLENLKAIISKENIDLVIHENFVGRELKDNTKETIANELISLASNEVNEIVEYNYSIAKEKLDINKNIYWIENVEKINYTNLLFEFINSLYNIQQDLNIEVNKSNEIWKSKEWIEQEYKKEQELNDSYVIQIKQLEEINENNITQIQKLNNILEEKNKVLDKKCEELNNVYNSKRWKLINKVAKYLKK